MIMGMHNYFQIATCVSSDFADMGREVDVVKLSQLKRKALSTKGDYKGFSFIEKKYGKSKQIRFLQRKAFGSCGIYQAQESHVEEKIGV